jgi:hypothetical protein
MVVVEFEPRHWWDDGQEFLLPLGIPFDSAESVRCTRMNRLLPKGHRFRGDVELGHEKSFRRAATHRKPVVKKVRLWPVYRLGRRDGKEGTRCK